MPELGDTAATHGAPSSAVETRQLGEGDAEAFLQALQGARPSEGRLEVFLVGMPCDGADTMAHLRDKVLSLPDSASCPDLQAIGNISQTANAIISAISLANEEKNSVIFLSGAASVVRDGRFSSSIQRRSRDELRKAALKKRGFALVIPYQKIDGSVKTDIINFFSGLISDSRHSNYFSAGNISLNLWNLKEGIDFSDIPKRAAEAAHNEIEKVAARVFLAVWDITRDKLNTPLQDAMNNIADEKREHILSLLVKGMKEGGSRANDRPWDIYKVAEESRKRILSAVVREIVPVYNPAVDSSPEKFIHDNIKPYLDSFSLPLNCLGQMSPSAYSAKYGR